MSEHNFTTLSTRYKFRSVINPRRLGIQLKRHGRNLVTTCPFHSPDAQSMFFFDSLGYWEFKCVECGVGGDLIDYIAMVHFSHLDSDKAREAAFGYWEQNLSAAEKASLDDQDDHIPVWLKSGIFERSRVLDAFIQYCVWNLESNAMGAEFLANRGWTVARARIYGIGFYTGEVEPFLDYCALQGIDQSLVHFYLDQIDVLREPCLTFPARNSKGQIYTVFGRHVDPEASSDYFSFSSVSIDVPFNITPGITDVLVVAGIFDCLTADLAGISGVVSLIRRPLTPGHLYKLKACGAETLTMVMERGEDRYFQETQIEHFLKLTSEQGLIFKSVFLPKGSTTESFLHQFGLQEFLELLHSTAPDTSRTRRRATIVQEISENYEENMVRLAGEFYGLNSTRFARFAQHLGGIQPGYYLISSHSFIDKSSFLISFGMDLIESNEAKMIYVTFEMPRKQVFNRMVAMLSGYSHHQVQMQSSEETQNQEVLEATKSLMNLVKANRLEVWDDNQVLDDKTLLRMLREEVMEQRNVFVCIDGFYRIVTKTHTDIPDIDERRSAVMLDIYKTLGIPVFCTGEMEVSKWVSESGRAPQLMDIITPQAYVRDPASVLFLCQNAEGNTELHLLKNRMGGSAIRVELEMDESGVFLREK